MKTLATLLVLFLSLSLAAAADCPKDQPKTEAALINLENTWADALSRKDADAVACLLADEFEDADVDGSLKTRAETLAHIPQRKPGVNRLSEMRAHVDGSLKTRAETLAHIPQRKPGVNRLSEMRAHVEGDFGFTRGLAELVDASGKVIARVRFTDVWTYRDGRWQAFAGHESLLSQASR